MTLCELESGTCPRCGVGWAGPEGVTVRRRCIAPPPAIPSAPPRHLAIVTTLFDATGHRVYLDNWRTWRTHLQPLVDSGRIHSLLTAQAVWPGQTAVGELVYQATPQQVAWQKERLINLSVAALPAEVDAVAWIDSDLIFANPHWPEDAKEALTTAHFVQLYSQCVRTRDARGRAVLDASVALHRDGTPGGAFAARRQDILLPERHPLGGGDVAALRAWKARRMTISCIPGITTHLYHGHKAGRSYKERHRWLSENRFDPETDLRIGDNGLIEWTRDDLQVVASEHFHRRIEGLP